MNWTNVCKLREADCFCSRYDENRQTMFYCSFFATLAGFIWFVIGFSLKCAFFTQAFGPSVNAVACGIMVVGIMVLILGLCFTLSIVCTGKSTNKISASSSSSRLRSTHVGRKDRIYFDSPLEDRADKTAKLASTFRSGSFSSTELNPSSSSTIVSSPSSTSSSAASFKSDIAIIA